jgi:hypothetical protein
LTEAIQGDRGDASEVWSGGVNVQGPAQELADTYVVLVLGTVVVVGTVVVLVVVDVVLVVAVVVLVVVGVGALGALDFGGINELTVASQNVASGATEGPLVATYSTMETNWDLSMRVRKTVEP